LYLYFSDPPGQRTPIGAAAHLRTISAGAADGVHSEGQGAQADHAAGGADPEAKE